MECTIFPLQLNYELFHCMAGISHYNFTPSINVLLMPIALIFSPFAYLGVTVYRLLTWWLIWYTGLWACRSTQTLIPIQLHIHRFVKLFDTIVNEVYCCIIIIIIIIISIYSNLDTHTHTHIYIYIYTRVCVNILFLLVPTADVRKKTQKCNEIYCLVLLVYRKAFQAICN